MSITTEAPIFNEKEWKELVEDFTFSPRLEQVAACILRGMSDKQIALELALSTATVRTYLKRIFRKFDVQDRTELTLHIFRHFRKGCRANGCPRR